LGLSVVNKIIEKHKGAITVDSEVGVGTVFTISLKKEGLEV
jgi:signal transduction histidine kinase